MERVKIEEIDKDVYNLSLGKYETNSMFVSGAQLRALRDDVKSFFEEDSDARVYKADDSYSVEDLKD